MDGEKDRTKEATPVRVPHGAKQAGDIRARWAWVEPSVWTDRMLTALENGVKGGVWFSLIDKVCSAGNLRSAFARVKANRGSAGVDLQTIEMFEADLEANLRRLEEGLRTGSYSPQAIRRVYIPKPGKKELRPLGIPTVRDRVAQAAVRHVLEPIFERDFAAHSYGLRLHPDKTRVVDAALPGGFDFLGYHFERGYRWPGRKSLGKIRDSIRQKTRRTNGHSLPEIISQVNRSLKGWFEYFKHGHFTALRDLDGWVRMRLRSILRRRSRGRGRGCGKDHQRWPNKFFAAQGLFSLLTAQQAERQPRAG